MTIHERFPFSWKSSKYPVPKKKNDFIKVVLDVDDKQLKMIIYGDYLDREIEMLGLSNRSHLALKRNAVNTIKDLIDRYDKLAEIKNLGKKSVGEIKSKLFNDYIEWFETKYPDQKESIFI